VLNLEKKEYLTNAFDHFAAPKGYKERNEISDAYKFFFNADDVFNHYLADKYWSRYYRRMNWRSAHDDFIFTSLLFNFYTLYREANEKETVNYKKAIKQLALGLFTEMEY
jgi:hypothetical protein